MRALGLFGHASGGIAAVEFALVATFLVPLAVGACDLGMVLYRQMAIENAAWAGASRASLHGWTASSPGDIQSAATAASGYAPTSVSAIQEYGCDNNGAIQPTNKGGNCTSGLTAGTFVVVTATAVAPIMVPVPGLPASFTLSYTALARIK